MPRGGRGRGRGGGRGRGRGRGRGAMRGGRGRGQSSGAVNKDQWTVEKQELDVNLDINTDVKKFFLGQASFEQHYDAQEANKLRYAAGITVLEKNGVEISQNARVRALAAAWARRDHDLAQSMLINKTSFGLVEVLKALTLMDSSRRIRVEEKKLKRLQTSGAKVKTAVLGKFKSNIDNLNANKPKYGSASGAICKKIRTWVRRFSTEELEFFALHYPTEPWKRLADICHFNPKKDFPNLPWFLPYCYGEPAPEGSMVRQCKDVTADTVNDLLKEYPIPYSHIKDHKDKLSPESKAAIAATDKLDTVIWWYEDLQCEKVDEIIKHRLENGESITLTDGKLLERMLTIKMIREGIPKQRSYYSWTGNKPQRNPDPTKGIFLDNLIPEAKSRLDKMSLPLEPPIVVIGDRSGSMEVAIRTSTIIAALLAAIVKSKLVFFNTENMNAEKIPEDINDILEMAVTITAQGGTSPAVSLWPFYEQKEKVNTFIIVTDEEENRACNNMFFDEMFDKYHKEVFPANLVFVSFLRHQHAEGIMVKKLINRGHTPKQFKFEGSRPDLDKLANLFGLLSSETQSFEDQLKKAENDIQENGIKKVFEQLKIGDNK